MNIRERLLGTPFVYRTFKKVVLPDGVLDRLVATHFHLADGGSVLDLGCGVGDYAPLYAPRCHYVGADSNASYIEMARGMNGGSGATFVVADVADESLVALGPFDLVLMSGVLHHLTADEVTALVVPMTRLLSPAGRFVALEPVFDPEQGLTARLVIASDRGRHVRDAAGYRHLLEPHFTRVTTSVVTGLLRIPYTHLVIDASSPVDA